MAILRGKAAIILTGLGMAFMLARVPARAADQALLAAARKEGSVTWYTSLIVNQVILPIKAAFEKKYPGVTLNYSRSNEEETGIKLLNEARGGHNQADIFSGLTIEVALKKAGIIAPFSVPNESLYPRELRDKDSTWLGLVVDVFTPGINTSMLPKAQAPKTYQDLLDPKWKGKMAWNPNSIAGARGFVGNILLSMGHEKGMEYLRALSKQHVIGIQASSRAILDDVIAGEFPIGLMMFNHHTVISARKGAPTDWIAMQPVPAAFEAVGLLENAPHPHAAKLLLDFLLSAEGQKVIAKANYLPALPSVPAMVKGLRPSDGGFKATWLRPEETSAHLAEWGNIVRDLFP